MGAGMDSDADNTELAAVSDMDKSGNESDTPDSDRIAGTADSTAYDTTAAFPLP